ncbi:hypothetical protein [Vreelandella rituensis]
MFISVNTLLLVDHYREQQDGYRYEQHTNLLELAIEDVSIYQKRHRAMPDAATLASRVPAWAAALEHPMPSVHFVKAAFSATKPNLERGMLIHLPPPQPIEEFLAPEFSACEDVDGLGWLDGGAWCPPIFATEKYTFSRVSPYQFAGDEIVAQRQRLQVLANRLALYHAAHGRFPALVLADGTPLGTPDAGDSVVSTSIAASLGGLAAGDHPICESVVQWDSLPVECADVVSVWGKMLEWEITPTPAGTAFDHVLTLRAKGSPFGKAITHRLPYF